MGILSRKMGGITDLGIVTGKRGSSRFGYDLRFPNRNFSPKNVEKGTGKKAGGGSEESQNP